MEDKFSHKIKLEDLIEFPIKRKFIYKTSGYLLNNITNNCENEFFNLKVETNLHFKIILNNNIIFTNDDYFESLKNLDNLNKNFPDPKRPNVNFYEINTFNSKNLCLNKNTLNQITIFYQFYYDKDIENDSNTENTTYLFEQEFSKFFKSNVSDKNKQNINSKNKNTINNIKAHFILSYVKDHKIHNFKTLNFIPFTPYESFKLDKSKITSDIEILNCNVNDKNYKFTEKIKTKIFLCSDPCIDSEENSICKKAFNSGIIPNTGGNFITTIYNNNLKFYAIEFPKSGLDYMITDLKLGYEDDFKKFSQQANTMLFKNYIVKIEVNSTLNEDDSFLFYKKDLVIDKSNALEIINDKDTNYNNDTFIILNAKLICDNSEEITYAEIDKNNENSNCFYKFYFIVSKLKP